MLSAKDDTFELLIDTTTLFTDLVNNEIYLKITPSEFSIIARYRTPLFYAMMVIPPEFFAEYNIDRNHNSKISLRSFRNAMMKAQKFSSSMTMLLQERENTIILIFEPPRPSAQPFRREMSFLRTVGWSFGEEVYFGSDKILSIASELFLEIMNTFSVYNEADSILITLRGSEATFSVVQFAHWMSFTEEHGDCLIFVNRGFETQMHMPIHPSAFFINCVLQAQRVWFYETADFCTIMHVPFGVIPELFMITCFPSIIEDDLYQDESQGSCPG